MRTTALVTAIVLAATTSANAVFVGFDTVANNTLATAQPLVSSTADWNAGSCALSADVGIGSLAAGDVDFFSLTIPNGCILTAITTPLEVFPAVPDTILGVWDSLGFVDDNDDAGSDSDFGGPTGPTRGSAVRYNNNSGVAQTISLAVSGFPDFGYTGAHQEGGAYLLTISLVPEPATLGLLLGGLLVFARRRK